MSFSNSTKLDHLDTFEKGYFEIQDRSSQCTGTFFNPKAGEQWWDSCAASGGKSLMLLDLEPAVKLTVSDIRASMLENLKERFKRAGVTNYKAVQADLSKEVPDALLDKRFDKIIADVPCTGSGTWGRTPEQISFFKAKEISRFSDLQYHIASNALKCLKNNGELIYITCSVFEEENNKVVERLAKSHAVNIIESHVIQGYEHKADSMFVARLLKL